MSAISLVQDNDGKGDQLGSVVKDINTLLGYDAVTGVNTRVPSNGTWQPIAATSGTDTACTNGTVYVGRIYIPQACLATGIRFLIGSVGGTNNVIVTLYNEAGMLLRSNAVAGTLIGTAANAQAVDFALNGSGAAATTINLDAGYYWIGLTFNGTTAKFRSVPAFCNQTGQLGNGLSQTFGTVAASITPPTTFTADKCPVACLY